MKLGGLTWWRSNYGSVLQAYALQEVVNDIDDVEYEIICQYAKKIASASNLFEKLKSIGVLKTLKKIFWKFLLKKLRNRNNNFQIFIDKNLILSKKEYSEETIVQANDIYDGFICGSDQIWNTTLVKTDEMYWLGFANDEKKKIAYAPSVGVKEFPEEKKEIIKHNLNRFNAISTREPSSSKLINELLGEEKSVPVLDPTLLIDKKVWDKLSEEKIYEEEYIFVYLLRGTKTQRKFIEEYAKKKSLKIVTMPFLDPEKIEKYDFKFGDIKLWDANPAQFIQAIRHSKMVFTDSFHSMVFSSIYHKNFYLFPKIGKAQMSRLNEFQELFGMENRLIKENTTIDEIDNFPTIDWEKFESVLADRKEKSMTYLCDAIIK